MFNIALFTLFTSIYARDLKQLVMNTQNGLVNPTLPSGTSLDNSVYLGQVVSGGLVNPLSGTNGQVFAGNGQVSGSTSVPFDTLIGQQTTQNGLTQPDQVVVGVVGTNSGYIMPGTVSGTAGGALINTDGNTFSQGGTVGQIQTPGSFVQTQGSAFAFQSGTCEAGDLSLLGEGSVTAKYIQTYVNVASSCVAGGCAGNPVEIVFVNDESGSIGSSDFALTLDFISAVITLLDPASVISYVEFSGSASASNDEKYMDKATALTKIANENYASGGSTNISAGMNLGQQILDTNDSTLPKVMIVLTDGSGNNPCPLSNGNFSPATDTTYVGVSVGTSSSVLDCLTGGNDFNVNDFNQLGSQIESIVGVACA